MVRRVAAIALGSGAEPIVVVTGHEAASVGAALQGLGVTLILNPDYADGLSTSLRAGLSALPSGIDGALILLGDMPEVEGSVVGALMASITGESTICVPVRDVVGTEARDPHLASDDSGIGEDADAVGVTGAELFVEQDRDDQLWEPGAPPPEAAPLGECSPLDPAIPGALHLMIEAIQGNRTATTEIERKL